MTSRKSARSNNETEEATPARLAPLPRRAPLAGPVAVCSCGAASSATGRRCLWRTAGSLVSGVGGRAEIVRLPPLEALADQFSSSVCPSAAACMQSRLDEKKTATRHQLGKLRPAGNPRIFSGWTRLSSGADHLDGCRVSFLGCHANDRAALCCGASSRGTRSALALAAPMSSVVSCWSLS